MIYLNDILETIKQELGVNLLEDNSRIVEIVDARKIYCDIGRELTPCSLKKIGSNIKKHHATVIHLIRGSNNLKKYDKEYLKKFNLCFRLLNEKKEKSFKPSLIGYCANNPFEILTYK